MHADLTASGVTVPVSGTGGTDINVGFTVTNAGLAVTNTGTWTDEIVFSQSATFNPATESLLGSFVHTGALQPGQSYTASDAVTLPLQFNGTGYITVLTDPLQAVTEPDRGQEYIATPASIAITAPYSDLTTEAVSAPTAANQGNTISVSWRVRNLGDAATATGGGWTDQIWLTTNGTVTTGSILLGTMPHSTGLAVGASYTSTANFQLPANLIGTYQVVVVTNANGADFEDGLTGNNSAAAPASLVISPTPLP